MLKKALSICLAGFLSLGIVSTAFALTTDSVASSGADAENSIEVVSAAFALIDLQRLGKLLYFDRYLSKNKNQSCSSCHDPGAGFSDPLNLRLPVLYPVSVGSDVTLNGGRNAPTAAYAKYSPSFSFNAATGLYTGGQFWDGRASTLTDQAKGPFLNPVEMGMKDMAAVIAALKDPANKNAEEYQLLFMSVYGIDLANTNTSTNDVPVKKAYNRLASAIAAFERTVDFIPFSSKFDSVRKGLATFTASEANGWAIFSDPARGNCTACHPASGTGINSENLFTDFTYDNLGIPKSTNALISGLPVDLGLGAGGNPLVPAADLPLLEGKFKVSSLRNIELTAPYGHNGYFATLEQIIHFYNTRDVAAENWPAPEVPQNVNVIELGNLNLTAAEEADLVAFLKTLTDGDK